jgi:ketosteroid isomerase-like protein
VAESNEALVRRFFDTLNAEDLEGLKPMFHPEATWTPMTQMDIPGAAVHRGRTGIVDEFLKPVRGLFVGKDPQNQINSLVAQGNLVALETHGTGQLTNGKTYDNRYCWIVEIRDGMIFAIREYMDTAYIQSLFA